MMRTSVTKLLAVLIGLTALSMPLTASARHDDDDRYRHGRGHYKEHHRHYRHQRDHWRHDARDTRVIRERVVVREEPRVVYERPRHSGIVIGIGLPSIIIR